jgi:predicted TIM-barrel fold metal-dependent hydrolase
MADWPPVIDADGHVLERQSDIRKYLAPPWNRRNTGLWPSDQPFDTDLFDTLGYPGYGRGTSPAQQVETWLKIMDEYNIEQAVLFPTGSGNIPKLREPEFCVAACRAANDHFAKEYNALSKRIHCVGVLPLKWPEEAAKELRRAVTELGLVSFELLSMGLPTALGDPMYDPLYEEAQRLDVPLSVHGNRSSSAEVGAGALRTFAEVHCYTFPGSSGAFPQAAPGISRDRRELASLLARSHGRALGITRRVRGAASQEKTQRGGARIRGLL